MKIFKSNKNLKTLIKKTGLKLLFPVIVVIVAVTAGLCHFFNPYNIITKTEKFYKA